MLDQRARPDLPDWHQLLAAFCGEIGNTPGDHLIIRWAQNLAHLHRARHINPDRSADIDRRRDDLVILIDRWIATHVIARTGARQPMESLGRAVDEVAAAYVAAEYLLMTADRRFDTSVHEAFGQASCLACRWTDLVAAVIDGQIRSLDQS